jgi:Fur family transcriptional regulator, ferric uptake regulator
MQAMARRNGEAGSQVQLLRSAGLRSTQARLSVLAALSRSRGPLAASVLIRQLGGPVELTTIYRTLETLTRKGLVHRVRGADDRAWRYALGGGQPTASHRHPHFLCSRCGRIECLSAVELPREITQARLPERYVLDFAEVVLHGRCARCRSGGTRVSDTR